MATARAGAECARAIDTAPALITGAQAGGGIAAAVKTAGGATSEGSHAPDLERWRGMGWGRDGYGGMGCCWWSGDCRCCMASPNRRSRQPILTRPDLHNHCPPSKSHPPKPIRESYDSWALHRPMSRLPTLPFHTTPPESRFQPDCQSASPAEQHLVSRAGRPLSATSGLVGSAAWGGAQ